jgi:hypothetical protein
VPFNTKIPPVASSKHDSCPSQLQSTNHHHHQSNATFPKPQHINKHPAYLPKANPYPHINTSKMADNLSTPRITSQYLDAFTNKTVRIIGKVTQLRGETAAIDSDGVVTAHLNRVCCPFSVFVRFHGREVWENGGCGRGYLTWDMCCDVC